MLQMAYLVFLNKSNFVVANCLLLSSMQSALLPIWRFARSIAHQATHNQ